MVTYGDYFPKRVLHYCGISPEQKLFKNEEMTIADTKVVPLPSPNENI